jgi:hypothetical protein
MTTEKTVFISFIAFNVLMFVLAFSVAYAKKQNVTVYFWLLGIQSVCYLLFFFTVSKPSHVMGLGLWFVSFFLVQIALLSILVIIFLVRLNSATVWITLGALPIVAAICWYVDFNSIYLSLLPITSEKRLVMQEGVLLTSKGKPYTGRAKHKGDDPILHKQWNVEWEWIDIEGGFSSTGNYDFTHKEIWRLTQYKDGVKEGKEKFYLYSEGKIPGIFDFFDKEIRIKRTRYFGHTYYKSGLKDGNEEILYPYNYFGRTTRNAQYSNGELLWVKQTDKSGYNGKISIYDKDNLFKDYDVQEYEKNE